MTRTRTRGLIMRLLPALLMSLAVTHVHSESTNVRGVCHILSEIRLPLRETKAGWFVTSVGVNGKLLPFVIDTAAAHSGLVTQTADALHVHRDEDHLVSIEGLDGQVLRQFFVVRALQLGAQEWQDRQIIPLNRILPVGAADTILPVGVLGADILSQYDVELDFPDHTMALYQLSGCESAAIMPWVESYQAFGAQRTAAGGFLIPVRLDGRALRAEIDSGANMSSVDRAAAILAQTEEPVKARQDLPGAITGAVTGASLPAQIHRFSQIQIGDSLYEDVPVLVRDAVIPGIEMLLGMDYLHLHNVWLSYRTDQVFVQDADAQQSTGAGGRDVLTHKSGILRTDGICLNDCY